MTATARVGVWYSVQSDYCHFLLDRLLKLSSAGVDVVIRPVLGIVLRMPEATRNRGATEQKYFEIDTRRTAEYMKLPYSYPDPSSMEFEPGSLWVASRHQSRIERLYRLFVGANRANCGLPFLNTVVRSLWDGSAPGWDTGPFLQDALAGTGLDHDETLERNGCQDVRLELDANHEAMLEAGHHGVPLMVFNEEPFYGQDRFDQLVWRLGIQLQ